MAHTYSSLPTSYTSYDGTEIEDDCADGLWSRPSQPPSLQVQVDVTTTHTQVKESPATPEDFDKKSIIIAFLSLFISIPALIGSWCWPLLLATILGVAATAASRSFAHTITFGITVAILSNLAQYVYHKCSTRKGTHFNHYGPFYLCALSVPLVCADLIRHVLEDNEMLSPAASRALAMYRPDCDAESMRCLSVAGWFFTIIMTYLGYLLLFVGNFWCINFTKKVKDVWNMRHRKKTNT